MVYRSLHGLAPNYLSSKFERRELAYNLRNSKTKLNVPLLRNSNDYSKKTVRNGTRGKQLFIEIFFIILVLGIFKFDEF